MLTRGSHPLAAATVVATLVAGLMAWTEANRDGPAAQGAATVLAPSGTAEPDPPAGAAPADPGPSGAAPGAAPPESTGEPVVRELEIEVTIGPADDRQVCTVVADLTLPAAAGPDHRVPAILKIGRAHV